MRRSLTRSAEAFLIVIVVIVGVALYLGLRSYYAPQPTTSTSTTATPSITGTTSPTSTTTSSVGPASLTLAEVEAFALLNETPSLGPVNASKVIVVVYDPECPYCALELNATLPFLYYVSVNTSQARVIFLGLPIHEYSAPMLEILDAVYNRYGQGAFANLLDWNYAYYVYWIEQYEQGKTQQLVVPTNATLLQMAEELGYNVTQAEVGSYESLVNLTASFLIQHGITATPTLLAYDGQGAPVYVQVGLTNPNYLVCNLTERLSLSVPGITC